MAWNFADQIHSLTGFDADTESASETGENFSVLAQQWLTDAAKEIINFLPSHLLKLCTSKVAFGAVSQVPGSEAETLNTGKILSVFAGNYQAREIPSSFKHKANDPDAIEYATVTDPIFYIEGNKINILPSGLTAATLIYEEVQYPAVAFDATNILVFPDEAEYLVPIRAAITAAEYQLAIEEDLEIYNPIITNLYYEYEQGMKALGANIGRQSSPQQPQQPQQQTQAQ